MGRFIAFLLLFVGPTIASNLIPVANGKVKLNKDVELEWSYDETDITLKLTAPTVGWIGVGFSPGGTMAGADIIIAGVEDGKGYILDAYATENGAPKVDNQQDVEGLQFRQRGGRTTVVMTRKLITSDQNDWPIEPGNIKIIWAYGIALDIRNKPSFYNYHFWRRGTKEVKLIPEESEPITYRTELHKEVTLKWHHTDESITFEVSAPTLGWVGLGFSPGETMVGADIIIGGWEDFVGKNYIFDGFAIENGAPDVDEDQDIDLLKVKREFGRTTITFRRKLITGDAKDMAILEGEMNVIWAYGILDVYSRPGLLNYHLLNRGSKRIELLPRISGSGFDEPIAPSPTSEVDPQREANIVLGSSLLDRQGDVEFAWRIDSGKASFTIKAPDQGWIGLGFNNNPTMEGADLVIGYVDSLGNESILDAYAIGNQAPNIDQSSDVELISFLRSENGTIMTFERNVAATDSQDRSLENDPIYVLWAYGNNDLSGSPSITDYHGSNRGAKLMNLFPE